MGKGSRRSNQEVHRGCCSWPNVLACISLPPPPAQFLFAPEPFDTLTYGYWLRLAHFRRSARSPTGTCGLSGTAGIATSSGGL